MIPVRKIRIIPPLDRFQVLREAAQTWWGKCAILVAFGALLSFFRHEWWREAMVLLAATTFVPSCRKWVLVIGSLYWLLRFNDLGGYLAREVIEKAPVDTAVSFSWAVGGGVAAVFAVAFLFSQLTHRWRIRRPLTWFLLFLGGMIFWVSLVPLQPSARLYLWAFILVLSRYVWYIAYSLEEARRDSPTPFLPQVGYYYPFWASGLPGISLIPIPKGAGYIRKIECKTPEELAVVQLKAVKLLMWAILAWVFYDLLRHLMYGTFGTFSFLYPFSGTFHLPNHTAFMGRVLEGKPYPALIGWGALWTDELLQLATLTMNGAVIVAICRMAGFNALRATYKPLYSRTFLDYWNRYAFYFKEIMVDHFFYPTFFRYFKRHPRLRLFFATLAAATFGNCILHLLFNVERVMQVGPWKALTSFTSYVFYAVVLGVAVGVSQLRSERHRVLLQAGWFRREVLCRINVLGFSSLLWIFGSWRLEYSLGDYFKFLLSLFGVRV